MSPTAFREQDHAAMRLAIEASRQALASGDNPFGATLASPEGQVLHTARNNQNTTRDCTGHAEMVLVREASAALGPEALRGATVFASGEPCAMCAGAMFWAGIARVVYAASQQDIAQALGGPQLATPCADLLAQACPPVAVQGGLLRAEAAAALRGA
ncbi:nucleoside deaminase [Acidovorax sp. A1169]|uniref:nucleoside deaminase n=1 Tax=Acidovorax sp. A1169 TaxID=3059524 RepID=UPI002737CBC9|nr:nucleoside deaminase [Acidovorax sp. A1169]MDP4073954.1 nucleoside deaminase [Acidovorax sp. A1169]